MLVCMATLETTSGPPMVPYLKLLNKGRNPDGMNFIFRWIIPSRFGNITIYMINLIEAHSATSKRSNFQSHMLTKGEGLLTKVMSAGRCPKVKESSGQGHFR